jgi:hypothetical protein
MLQYIGRYTSLSGRVWRDGCGDIVENQTKKKMRNEDLRL